MQLERPDAAWRRRARVALLGSEVCPRVVVASPFSAILDARVGVAAAGWWSGRMDEDVALVVTPQGSPAADLVFACEPGTSVWFVGACGSLDPRGVPVGSLASPRSATTPDGATFTSRPFGEPAIDVDVDTAWCLTASSAIRGTRPRRVVEMEVAWLLAAGATADVSVSALLVVSDENAHGAVFGSRFDDVEAGIERARRLVFDRLRR